MSRIAAMTMARAVPDASRPAAKNRSASDISRQPSHGRPSRNRTAESRVCESATSVWESRRRMAAIAAGGEIALEGEPLVMAEGLRVLRDHEHEPEVVMAVRDQDRIADRLREGQ